METIFDIAKIAGGLLLAQQFFAQYDSVNTHVNKLAKWLAGFQSIIGGALLGFGVYFIIRPGCFIMDASGFLGGVLLLGFGLKEIPLLGEWLLKLSIWLKPFTIPLGIAVIISGVLGLFTSMCL